MKYGLYTTTNHMNYYMFAYGTNDLEKVAKLQRLERLLAFMETSTPPPRRRTRSEASSSPEPRTESSSSRNSVSLASTVLKTDEETEIHDKAECSQNNNKLKKRLKCKNFFLCHLRRKSISLESIAVNRNKPNNEKVSNVANIQSNGTENHKLSNKSSTNSTKADKSFLEKYKQFKQNIEKKFKRLKLSDTKDKETTENNEKIATTSKKNKIRKRRANNRNRITNINNVYEYDYTYRYKSLNLTTSNRTHWHFKGLALSNINKSSQSIIEEIVKRGIIVSKTINFGAKAIFVSVTPKQKIASSKSCPALGLRTKRKFRLSFKHNYSRSLLNIHIVHFKESRPTLNNFQTERSESKGDQESQGQQKAGPQTNSTHHLLSPSKIQKINSQQLQETVVQIEHLPSKFCDIAPMGRMGSLEDHERKVIIEFCHLLEKSKQLFNGLRELPQYGHKQWHSYFGRTFDVYTKLWKFQQQFRAILDSKYGLKRWQIGEIASKIGQLYYHFYLRTSETAYLNEAFSFYYAIRGRSYYTKASKEDKCELMVKKLRYYARFIVVCLLLKKIKLVRELIKELDRQIIEYGNTYDPDDQIEWTVVVDEVKAFIQAEPVVSVIHPDSYPIILSHRLSQLTTPPVEKTSQMNLTLQEVLIVGSSSQQVKFSELTMDMFRMLQTLEREPTGDVQHSVFDDSPRQRFNLTPSALNNKGYNLDTGASRCENPHKYLLFKPSPSQILVYLASGCNDLPPNGALLLYISADGQIVPPSKHPEDVAYDVGGLITTSKNDLYRDCGKDQKAGQSKCKELQCFHPGDLYPFTRRPLFVIIESDNSYVYQNMPRHFGQPLVVLMSPLELPTSLHSASTSRGNQGSLFTLFLHSPLTAFCHICDIHTISLVHWERAQSYIDTFMTETSQIITRSRIDPTYLSFMGDEFLRLLTIRFIFCEVVLRLHRSFRARTQLPRSSPPIPEELLEHPALIHITMDLAAHLQVRQNFHDPSAPGPNSKD